MNVSMYSGSHQVDVRPISPDDVAEYKAKIFPNYVIQAFNDLIASKSTGSGEITIKQCDAITKIIEYAGKQGVELERSKIFQEGWLNVEEIYRAAGWRVDYDKPSYCESYEAFFKFERKRDR